MKRRVNYYFLAVAGILLGFGVLFLATLSAISSLQIFGNTNYYLFHQLLAAGAGLVLGFIAFKIPLRFFRKIAFAFFIINLLLLAVVFIPSLGLKFWGAQRWINIGGITFQPSELFKISAILFISAWLSSKAHRHSKKGWVKAGRHAYEKLVKLFIPFLLLLALIAGILLMQRDMSTLGVITISLLAVYFSAGTPLWHTIIAIAAGAGGALALIAIEPYRLKRLLVFLDPETDPLGIGFQLRQSLLALGSGGIFGKGLGMSTQKFGFLPQAMTDSVFPIIGEETGIVGAGIVMVLFILFFWLGIKIANRSSDTFSRLTAIGLSTWIIAQALMNIASSAGIFPLAGIPLPFFSYGGSHLIAEIIAVGILLNISKNA